MSCEKERFMMGKEVERRSGFFTRLTCESVSHLAIGSSP
jgi:hypothetical protein